MWCAVGVFINNIDTTDLQISTKAILYESAVMLVKAWLISTIIPLRHLCKECCVDSALRSLDASLKTIESVVLKGLL